MTFDQYIGMQHGDRDDGETSARIDIEPARHGQRPAHQRGVIISLADNILTGAANRACEIKTGERKFMVGVDLHAVMLANQQGGTIRGIAVRCASAAGLRPSERRSGRRRQAAGGNHHSARPDIRRQAQERRNWKLGERREVSDCL